MVYILKRQRGDSLQSAMRHNPQATDRVMRAQLGQNWQEKVANGHAVKTDDAKKRSDEERRRIDSRDMRKTLGKAIETAAKKGVIGGHDAHVYNQVINDKCK